ncbi:MAG: hypothetical protein EU530_02315 [Promethearchaeota archaeon]|nr:MAG: hypothetical protein EU530_02315 [Candidatus Lokiarchaeota archaeon]
MAQIDETKRKTRFVRSFTVMQLMMYIIVFIVIIFVKNVTFSSTFTIENWILSATNGITAIFCFALMIRSFALYRKRKSLQNAYLAGFFLFTWIPAIIIAITTLFVPTHVDLGYFLSLAIFFLTPGSTVFLATFISETFYESIDSNKKLGQLLFFVTQFSATIANVIGLLLVLIGASNFKPWALILVQIFGGFFILLNVFLHFLLFYNAVRLRANIDDKNLKAGLALLAITGVLLGIVFFGRLFDFLLLDLAILGIYQNVFIYGLDILFFVGYLTMWLGVAIPGRKHH